MYGQGCQRLSKKTIEHKVVMLIDHVLANNMRSMIELAMVWGSITKFEAIFKSQDGKDVTTLLSELRG